MTPSPLYREIPLTKGQVAIVDADNYEWLNQWKWQAGWRPAISGYYAQRASPMVNGISRHTIFMHRQILGLQPGDPLQADHKDPSLTLMNTRENLRIASRSQQQHNQKCPRNNKCGFKGVTYDKARHQFKAHIRVGGKVKSLGYRRTAEDAHALYCEAAAKYRGEFARSE